MLRPMACELWIPDIPCQVSMKLPFISAVHIAAAGDGRVQSKVSRNALHKVHYAT